MKFQETVLDGVFVIDFLKNEDNRGSFTRTFCKKEFATIGFSKEFVQINHSFNTTKGTLRGLHFQKMPFTESKLIRCIHGKVFDIVVDIRENSRTFLKYFGVELSLEKMNAIFIPEGFAHGYQTLEDNSALIYHHSQFYAPEFDGGIRFNDPILNINWPMPAINLSDKDKNYSFIDNNFKPIKYDM
jgi:dTDP-4-dehydrorhamnose 3,5-epimerase